MTAAHVHAGAATARPPAARRITADALGAALEHAAHLLPDQGPIAVFVHHNTLHAYQHLPFHDAVRIAHHELGGEPYAAETWFREQLGRGRITRDDLDVSLAATERALGLAAAADDGHGAPAPHAMRLAALLDDLGPETPAGLAHRIAEGGLLDALPRVGDPSTRAAMVDEAAAWILDLLRQRSWDEVVTTLTGEAHPEAAVRALEVGLGVRVDAAALRRRLERDAEPLVAIASWGAARSVTRGLGVTLEPAAADPHGARTPREIMAAATGEDVSDVVHPFLVRTSAAYLDLGQAYWPMPGRERGYFAAVLELVASGTLLEARAVPGLVADARAFVRSGATATDVALATLDALGVGAGDAEHLVPRMLGALPGWAGMHSRLERHPEDRAPDAPPARLLDFLAVQLLVERAALRDVAARHGSTAGQGQGLREVIERARAAARRDRPAPGPHDQALPLHLLATSLGLSPGRLRALGRPFARVALDVLASFDGITRRRVFQEAFERHHRVMILDALAAHRPHAPIARPAPERPIAQVVCCFDEREEAFRRAVEEVEPRIETFGTAGFFGLAMRFRAADDPADVPLCPVVVTPGHHVEERPHEEDLARFEVRTRRRRAFARLRRALGVGSTSLGRGAVLTTILGALHALPLALRVLSPRRAARLEARLARAALPEARTRIVALRDDADERDADQRAEAGRVLGFSVDEKVERLAATFRTTGLHRRLARLVVVLGHGSTTRNNPHASAYDCGACGGRSGRASARLFALAANLPEVRAGLRARGIAIPDDTWFVGGLHDLASSAITLEDLDRVPPTHAEDLAAMRRVLDLSRARAAHEQCRRFHALPLDASFEQALAHVEARSEAIAEPRPEYGHATNAVCFIGRRAVTRGLYLDRRAFVIAYDPTGDHDGATLERLLATAGPVGAGINLEYYFSFVDNERWGCGTKLPHNVTGLLGVMNGHASDLRTGLHWQTVEIHEPVRLLVVVEATPDRLAGIAARQPIVGELVGNGWIQLVACDPESGALAVFEDGAFVPFTPTGRDLPVVRSSVDWYRGHRDHLPPARIDASV